MYIFAVAPTTESLTFKRDPPKPAELKRKGMIILRVKQAVKDDNGDYKEINLKNIEDEIIFMEFNKNILENIHMVCNEVYMPIMANPLNMVGMSDLVSKDLMDKFHVFLAHTYVTIG